MNRQLTKKVLFEKKEKKINRESIRNESGELISNVEMLNSIISYNPNNYIANNVILFGITLNFDMFNIQNYLSEKENKIFIEDFQDEASVKLWSEIEKEIKIKKNNDSKTSDLNIEKLLFSFLEEKGKYSFLKKSDEYDINGRISLKLDYKFMSLKFDILNKESVFQICSGIFNELYFRFYDFCIKEKATINIDYINMLKFVSGKYESQHSFILHYYVSY